MGKRQTQKLFSKMDLADKIGHFPYAGHENRPKNDRVVSKNISNFDRQMSKVDPKCCLFVAVWDFLNASNGLKGHIGHLESILRHTKEFFVVQFFFEILLSTFCPKPGNDFRKISQHFQ